MVEMAWAPDRDTRCKVMAMAAIFHKSGKHRRLLCHLKRPDESVIVKI